MTESAAREKARAEAHRLMTVAFTPKGRDGDEAVKAVIHCGAYTNGEVHHTPLCETVTAALLSHGEALEAVTRERDEARTALFGVADRVVSAFEAVCKEARDEMKETMT